MGLFGRRRFQHLSEIGPRQLPHSIDLACASAIDTCPHVSRKRSVMRSVMRVSDPSTKQQGNFIGT